MGCWAVTMGEAGGWESVFPEVLIDFNPTSGTMCPDQIAGSGLHFCSSAQAGLLKVWPGAHADVGIVAHQWCEVTSTGGLQERSFEP